MNQLAVVIMAGLIIGKGVPGLVLWLWYRTVNPSAPFHWRLLGDPIKYALWVEERSHHEP